MNPRPLAAAALLIGAALRLPGMLRPGISTDEEFTWFAVQGIREHGLPLLPSGLLYDRGLLYSAASALSSAITGPDLLSFRLVSLIAGLLTILVVFRFANWVHGSVASAVLAALIVACSPLHAQLSTWARFYALFLMIFIAATHWSMKSLETPSPRLWGVSLAIACRLSHELAWALMLLPFAAWLLRTDSSFERARLRRVAGDLAAGLIAAEFLIWVAHAATGGWTTVDPATAAQSVTGGRFNWPPVHLLLLLPLPMSIGVAILLLAAFTVARLKGRPHVACLILVLASAAFVQFSLAAFFAVVSVLRRLWPARTSVVIVTAAVVSSLTVWVTGLHLGLHQPLSLGLLISIAQQGFAFGTSAIVYFWSHRPLTAMLAILGALIASTIPSPTQLRAQRLAVVLLLWVALLGVTSQSFEPRFLAAPMLLAYAGASGVMRMAAGGFIRRAAAGAFALALLASSVEEDRDTTRPSAPVIGAPVSSLASWQLATRQFDRLAALRGKVRPVDLVVCDDELLARMSVGRCDRLLVIESGYQKSSLIRGRRAGRLGGASLISSFDELGRECRAHQPGRIWVVLTGSGGFPPPAPEPYLAASSSTTWSQDAALVVLVRSPPIEK